VDAQTLGLETPLMKACASGNIDICNLLIETGCNPFI